jgi:hypothetical protein
MSFHYLQVLDSTRIPYLAMAIDSVIFIGKELNA